MNNRRLILAVFFVAGLIFIWWLLASKTKSIAPQGESVSNSQVSESNALDPTEVQTARVLSTTNVADSNTTSEVRPEGIPRNRATAYPDNAFDDWRTPISFYGRVVDETNRPVEGAAINFGWTDTSFDGYSRASTISDSNGFFMLEGRTGKHLSVKVSKEGYYAFKSNRDSFFYAGENENFIPSIHEPVIFRLKKKGVGEELITFERDFRISKNGEPVRVDLSTGRIAAAGQGDVVVECWTNDQGKKNGERYDWHCRVSVPGGGLVPSTNQFDFVAPVGGYLPFDEINMPTTLESGWQRNAERKYFLKTSSGNYARIKLKMIAGGGHFFALESALNPNQSRNLEPRE